MGKRHIFILNPAAGQGKAFSLEDDIIKTGIRLGMDVEIYKTKEVLDAQVEAVRFAQSATPESPVRLYACGGDGTVNEILNGIVGYDNVELAIVPTGTGNDFIRNYGKIEDFLDIERQMLGQARKTDVIGYKSSTDSYSSIRYCINMFNIGFDCDVVRECARLKTKPLISGSMAYLLGVAQKLIQMKGTDLQIIFENGKSISGKLLLLAVGNGCYCGGGVKGIPYAKTDDGLMDVSIIKRCKRNQFIRLFPKYVKGEHLETKLGQEYIKYLQVKKLSIVANNDSMYFSTDGEITHTKRLDLEIVPNAINFSVPLMSEYSLI